MILEITLIVISILVVILGYTTINLLRKVEKSEDIIIRQSDYIEEFNKQIDIADRRLKKIDEKGMFKSDDEIGWFFKEVQRIQEALNEFTLK